MLEVSKGLRLIKAHLWHSKYPLADITTTWYLHFEGCSYKDTRRSSKSSTSKRRLALTRSRTRLDRYYKCWRGWGVCGGDGVTVCQTSPAANSLCFSRPYFLHFMCFFLHPASLHLSPLQELLFQNNLLLASPSASPLCSCSSLIFYSFALDFSFISASSLKLFSPPACFVLSCHVHLSLFFFFFNLTLLWLHFSLFSIQHELKKSLELRR